jgi:cytoskeletal protein CcmA (bactofilin family)
MKAAEGSTVIGRSITIHGDLSGGDDLVMDGQIDGSITLAESKLTVGANAQVKGELRARDITVLGRVYGNLHASGKVELLGTAVVQGDIFASRLSIEDDATVQGRAELIVGDEKSARLANASFGAATDAKRAGA